MIFATAGTQIPFDRFVKILDELSYDIQENIIVQSKGGSYIPRHIKLVDFIAPDDYDEFMEKSRLVIAHAGMGTIISALKQHKAIIVFPRLASLGEHRNDHQMATTKRLSKMGYIHAAYDKEQLKKMLQENIAPLKDIGGAASESLICNLNQFIDDTL